MKYKRIHNSCKTWTAKVCSMERNAKRMWLLEGEWVEQTHQDRTRLWALPSTVVRKERAENRAGKKSELTELEESKNNHEDLVKVLFAGWLLFQKLKDSSTNERGFYISTEHTQPLSLLSLGSGLWLGSKCCLSLKKYLFPTREYMVKNK